MSLIRLCFIPVVAVLVFSAALPGHAEVSRPLWSDNIKPSTNNTSTTTTSNITRYRDDDREHEPDHNHVFDSTGYSYIDHVRDLYTQSDTEPFHYTLIQYQFTREKEDLEETQLRRFDVTFFISLPASLLISFLGVFAFRIATDRTEEPFSPVEVQYMIFSTLGISLGVAIHDNRVSFRKSL